MIALSGGPSHEDDTLIRSDSLDPGMERSEGSSPEVYRFPSFLDRLEDEGGLEVRGMVDSDVDGVVYHHRGVRVPGYNATFVREEARSHAVPAFSVEIDAVGPRSAWAVFDATIGWDLFLVQYDGGVVLALLSDEEFGAEDAREYGTKAAAVGSGQFSFGIFLHSGGDWEQRADLLRESASPAIIQLGDGRVIVPESETQFYEQTEAIPVELREGDETAPDHLGLLEFHLSIDS